MNGFTLIIIRWYHGGTLDLSSGKSVYNGGLVTKFLDVDVDKMSYFELRDYIKKLRYITSCTFSIKAPSSEILVDVDNDMDIFDMMCSLEDGDEVEEESGASFNTRPNFRVSEDHLNIEEPASSFFPIIPPFNTIPLFTTAISAAAPRATAPTTAAPRAAAPSVAAPSAAAVDDIVTKPAESDFLVKEVEGSDYSNEDIVES
ncbi:hypothetical protein CQW23_30717 [Capsicum baccatum]|uniref:PB1-like domain-containing protein n=1 Tax=Capsicum baccatum TaxID=33114 RepID=A0A2G2V9M3_CAPBA|nr:hypothetical protein CQW23_30717 [Capsicum baccatum]